MKSSVMIYIDSELVSECSRLMLNRSAICNEALRLATLPKSETQTQENALGNFLKYKVEKLEAIGDLKKLNIARNRYPRNRTIAEKWYTDVRKFAAKYSVSHQETIALVNNGVVA